MGSSQPPQISDLLAEFREKQTAFEYKLWDRWKPAFDYYDWILLQAQNAAVFMLRHHRQEAVEHKDSLFEAQTRWHARAYRTACEVRALLLAGNPDGALARWRTIHEILVVMLFLQKHGTETAHQFLNYDVVQTAKNRRQYEELPERLRVMPLSLDEGEQILAERAKLLDAHLPAFKENNGWAAEALGITKARRITIDELESHVELSWLRFYYNIASNHIHVNMKGLANDLRDDLFPTMRGFSASAGTTLMELADCTVIMAKLRPTPDTEQLERDLIRVVAVAGSKFLEIQQQLEQETVAITQETQQDCV